MAMKWWPILAVALVLAGCGGGSESSSTGAASGPAPAQATTGASSETTAFFYRDGALVPVALDAPETEAVARAALERLLAGPPSGYETAIPEGVRLEGVTIANGLAHATFSGELGAPGRTAQGQIVATLTRFPTVESAELAVEGRGAVPLQGNTGATLGRPATSEDYADLRPDAPIFVRNPARDSTVTSPVKASGTANVFEATFQVEIWSGNHRLRTETITASAGSGTRGAWAATLTLPPGPAKLVFFEPSAEDGRPLHQTVVNLNVE
jgi:hypothetical protein